MQQTSTAAVDGARQPVLNMQDINARFLLMERDLDDIVRELGALKAENAAVNSRSRSIESQCSLMVQTLTCCLQQFGSPHSAQMVELQSQLTTMRVMLTQLSTSSGEPPEVISGTKRRRGEHTPSVTPQAHTAAAATTDHASTLIPPSNGGSAAANDSSISALTPTSKPLVEPDPDATIRAQAPKLTNLWSESTLLSDFLGDLWHHRMSKEQSSETVSSAKQTISRYLRRVPWYKNSVAKRNAFLVRLMQYVFRHGIPAEDRSHFGWLTSKPVLAKSLISGYKNEGAVLQLLAEWQMSTESARQHTLRTQMDNTITVNASMGILRLLVTAIAEHVPFASSWKYDTLRVGTAVGNAKRLAELLHLTTLENVEELCSWIGVNAVAAQTAMFRTDKYHWSQVCGPTSRREVNVLKLAEDWHKQYCLSFGLFGGKSDTARPTDSSSDSSMSAD